MGFNFTDTPQDEELEFTDKPTDSMVFTDDPEDEDKVSANLQSSDLGTALDEGMKSVERSQLRGTGKLSTLAGRGVDWAGDKLVQAAKALKLDEREPGELEKAQLKEELPLGKSPLENFGDILVEASRHESIQADPEWEKRKEQFSGWRKYLLDVAETAPQVGSQFVVAAVNPVLSGSAMFAQIFGGKLEQYEKQGIKDDQAVKSALFSAITQAPLEYWGASKVMGALGKNVKSKFVEWVKRVGEEGLTEWIQQYPDAFADIMAKNPDASKLKQLGEWFDKFGETTAEGLYQGLVAIPLAGGGAGVSVAFGKKDDAKAKTEDDAKKEAEAKILGKDIDSAFDGQVPEKELAGTERPLPKFEVDGAAGDELYFSRKGLGINEFVPEEELEAQRSRDTAKRKEEAAAEKSRIDALKKELPKEGEPREIFQQLDIAENIQETEDERVARESQEKADQLRAEKANELGEIPLPDASKMKQREDAEFADWEKRAANRTYTEEEAAKGRGVIEREEDSKEIAAFKAKASGAIYATSSSQLSSGMPDVAIDTSTVEKKIDTRDKGQAQAQIQQVQQQKAQEEAAAQGQAQQAAQEKAGQVQQAQEQAGAQENDRFIKAVSTPEGVMAETSSVLNALEKMGDKGVARVSKPIRALHKALSTNEGNAKKLASLSYDLMEHIGDAEQLDPKLSLIMTRLAKLSSDKITQLNMQSAAAQQTKQEEKKPAGQEKRPTLDTITVKLSVPMLSEDGKYLKHESVDVLASTALKENSEQQNILNRMLECLAG